MQNLSDISTQSSFCSTKENKNFLCSRKSSVNATQAQVCLKEVITCLFDTHVLFGKLPCSRDELENTILAHKMGEGIPEHDVYPGAALKSV